MSAWTACCNWTVYGLGFQPMYLQAALALVGALAGQRGGCKAGISGCSTLCRFPTLSHGCRSTT
jgi:hypothetical protein